MAVISFEKLGRLLSISAGTVLIALGSLALLVGLSGPEPIFLGWISSGTYIRLVPAPTLSSVHLIAFGCVSLGLGALVLAKSLWIKTQREK